MKHHSVWLAFVLFFAFIATISAQSKLPEKIAELYRSEHYFDCITESKRLLYFSSDISEKAVAAYYAGSAYGFGGFYDNAHEYLRLAEMNAKTEEFRWLCARKRALLFLETEKYDAAKKYITRFTTDSSKAYFADAAFWMSALTVPEGKQPDAGLKDASLPELTAIADEFRRSKKSELVYILASAVLPGSGQIALGDISGGLLSLAWTAATGYLTVYNFEKEKYLEGGLSAYFLFARFYSGNVRNTQSMVQNINQTALKETRLRLIRLLEQKIAEDEKDLLL